MSQVKSVAEVYKSVVSDVIDGVRESFIDEGVDEHILMDLKQMWENKLRLSKALDSTIESSNRMLPPPAHSHHQSKIYTPTPLQLQQQLHQQQQQLHQQQQFQQQQQQLLINSVSLANNKANNNRTTTNNNNTLQQLTSLQGSVLNLGSSQLGQATSQTISPLLLQHFNNVNCLVQQNSNNRPILIQSGVPGGGNYVQSQQGIIFGLSNQPVATSATPHSGVTLDSNGTSIEQLDGLVDSSSDEDEGDEDAGGGGGGGGGGKRGGKRGKFEEEEEEETPGQQVEEEDEPLNSDDDEKSDVESHDHFETDNVVVCQFDKVNRSKARWKFHLKDGIMNISGKDYVFQKATGDAEF